MSALDVVAFDGDDTLWHNETLFSMTHERFADLLADHVDGETLRARLLDVERANVGVYGFGVKGFTLSMVQTAIEVTDGNAPGSLIARILDFGKEQLAHPVELLPGVSSVLDQLAGRYRLMLVTKGDLFDQESKIARSGLSSVFAAIEVVAAKNAAVYARILDAHNIVPSRFLMVGDSVRSDVLPVIEVGGHAAHVPYHLTWELERAEPPHEHDRYWELEHLGQVGELLDQLEGAA